MKKVLDDEKFWSLCWVEKWDLESTGHRPLKPLASEPIRDKGYKIMEHVFMGPEVGLLNI
jgi:hypothetical protein